MGEVSKKFKALVSAIADYAKTYGDPENAKLILKGVESQLEKNS
jgi:hypothetical protein